MKGQLQRLSDAVLAEQDGALRSFDHEGQQARFLLHALAPARRAQLSRGRGVALLAAAAAAVALCWSALAPVRFRVAGGVGTERSSIAAPASEPLPLDFSDGSQLLLQPGAQARVLETSAQGARISLERGRLRARIVHRAHTRWRVEAGPFRVHVVGTSFDVSWNDRRFELHLHEGAVRVEGPSLNGARDVRAGQALEITLPKNGASRVGAAVLPAVPPASVPAAPRAPAASRPGSAWRALAATGSHERAFRALLAEGLEPTLRSGTPSDLVLAADLARFSGHPAEARRCLLALRARFAGTASASDAAFGLGRIAFDRQQEYAAAARWFEAYLAEQPDGVFQREVAGRLLECYVKLGDSERAVRSARRYLAVFPHGPHAQLAQHLLTSETEH